MPADLTLSVEPERGAIDLFTAWLPRLGIVLAFLFIGATKFGATGEWVRIFDRIGVGQWFRYFTGAMQVTGALLLLTRPTRPLGALMLGSTMIGAMIVDVVVMHAAGYALAPFILLCGVVAIWFAGRER
jgi:putative oxidoreductase